MKHTGLHWAVRAQLARRGGLEGTTILDEKATDGFTQALREANLEKDKGKKKGQNPHATNGGYSSANDACELVGREYLITPPGLEVPPNDNFIPQPPALCTDEEWAVVHPDATNLIPSDANPECHGLPNHWIGSFHEDVHQFGFTLMEDDYRLAIFGRGDWFIHSSPPPISLEDIGTKAQERWRMENLYQEYLGLIDPTLHCSLLNWMAHLEQLPVVLERNVASGLQNIMVRGNSQFRALAS